jgi:hypothetical protein
MAKLQTIAFVPVLTPNPADIIGNYVSRDYEIFMHQNLEDALDRASGVCETCGDYRRVCGRELTRNQ